MKTPNKIAFPFCFYTDDASLASPMTRCARLHFRRRGLSLFFTVTDLANNVISSLSLGQVSLAPNRKTKCSLGSINRLILKMRYVLRQHSIKAVLILFRSSFPWQLRSLERLLLQQGVEIVALEERLRISHGFIRLPKQPRK